MIPITILINVFNDTQLKCREHPGGGVKYGDMAQEECLCRSSNLYSALTQPYLLRNYYKWNSKNTGDMGTDAVIVFAIKKNDSANTNLETFRRVI